MAWIDLSSTTQEGSTKEAVPKVHQDGEVLHEGSRQEVGSLQGTGIQLRGYQLDTINKMKWCMTVEGNDLIVLPQGAGKSIIIAHFAHKMNQDILILQPSRELLAQNMSKLEKYVPKVEIGVYSASFKTKDIKKYTFATIQSAYKHPELFTHFKIVLLDECHLFNPKNFEGMYNRFFADMGAPKIFGLTATPYRNDVFYEKTGYFMNSVTTVKMINRYQHRIWQRMSYVMNTHELTEQGYLSPLKYYEKELVPMEVVPMNKSKSDFDLDKYVRMIDHQEVLSTIEKAREKYKSIIVFCPTIYVATAYNGAVTGGMVVSSMSTAKERAKAINGFRDGTYQVAFNVGILNTGFDHPSLDCIILCRPTKSLSLYAQMLGRGTRKAEGKTHCAIIDLTGTVRAMGQLDTIKVCKVRNEKGQDMWNVVSSTMPEGYHYCKLMERRLLPKVTNEPLF